MAKALDGEQIRRAAEYLRGRIQVLPGDSSSGVSELRAREAHLESYRRARRNALALWLETVGVRASKGEYTPDESLLASSTSGGWPDGGERERIPCLLWCSGRWHCANAGWLDPAERKKLKVIFTGYDEEDAVIVHHQDPRIRRAAGDHVRVHVIDQAESPVFLEEGVYLAGVIVSPLAAHDSCLVRVVSLTESELFLVPNTRLEHVPVEDFARVTDTLKGARNQVLRELDIATSQTIAIEIVSGIGDLAGDRVPVSLWALGNQMLIKVWQEKGKFTLTTSVSASEALAAVGIDDTGLNLLSDAEREQLQHKVLDRLRVSHGVLEMETGAGSRTMGAENERMEVYREHHSLEDISVETVVQREGSGSLRIRSKTLPPNPEISHDVIAQPEDWVSLGYPSLLWLNGARTTSLGRRLTRCLEARDGSVVLQIDRSHMLRPEGFIPMPSSVGNHICPSRTLSKLNANGAQKHQRQTRANPDESAGRLSSCCTSGAPPGLCSCQVILRTGVTLPLSMPELSSYHDKGKFDEDEGDEVPKASGTRRGLVLVKANGGELTLSVLSPSRNVPSSTRKQSGQTAKTATTGVGGGQTGGLETAGETQGEVLTGHGTSTTPPKKLRMLRRTLLLSASFADWMQLGYGPLQWMSHAQKALIASLSIYWVSFKMPLVVDKVGFVEGRRYMTKNDYLRFPGEAFLQFRPVLSGATRVVSTPIEMTSLSPDGDSSASDRQGSFHRLEASTSLRRVFVRDEGGVFRVEVEAGGSENEGQAQRGNWRLERTFGKSAWRNTGLGELLWMDCSNREYLARRLAQQVAISEADNEGSCDGQLNQGGFGEHRKLMIVSDLPLPYWKGTVTIARLGTRVEGVFVTITDAGRRLLIEARDYEWGPMLASSTVSFESWTAATGRASLTPPTDGAPFKDVLEDQLAALLGAGFRSCTSRLEKKRAEWLRQQQHPDQKKKNVGRGRWRGTFLELSEMEKGLSYVEGGDSRNEADDTSATNDPRRVRSSKGDMTPLEQKRLLRLEMLTRMIEEFQDKHGRRRHAGGKPRKKRVSISETAAPIGTSATNDKRGKNDHAGEGSQLRDPLDGGVTPGDVETSAVSDNVDKKKSSREKGNGKSSATLLPAIRPPPSAAKNRQSGCDGPGTTNRLRPSFGQRGSCTTSTTSSRGTSVSRDEEGSVVTSSSTEITPVVRRCVCCGGDGGPGHGRRCEHTFRQCGFCRVEEVSRVLGIGRAGMRKGKGRANAPGLGDTTRGVPMLLAGDDTSGKDAAGEEYEWVTDSDEESPEFECDCCGRVIEICSDRFHCETCEDYDLCQACFLSGKATSGDQSDQAEEGRRGAEKVRHAASHDVTRIIGRPTDPDSSVSMTQSTRSKDRRTEQQRQSWAQQCSTKVEA